MAAPTKSARSIATSPTAPTILPRRATISQRRARPDRSWSMAFPRARCAPRSLPIDRAFVRSIFTRDHPGTADDTTIEAFADAILALDDSVPTGTYVDMCARLPVVDPAKITAPTLIMRGEYDGIAGFDDLIAFF